MEERILSYDFALDYVRERLDRRVLPQVHLTIEFLPSQVGPVTISTVLDSGAQVSVLDGNAALEASWTIGDIVERAG